MDTISITLEISDDGANAVLSRTGQKVDDFINKVNNANPKIKFSIDNSGFIDLDKLEKRTNETRQSFASIAETRLNSGQVGFLTKDIILAHERARQLETDIRNIKSELSNPNRKSSIRFLTDELQAAQKESDLLKRKLSTLPNAPNAPASSRSRTGGNGQRGGITNAQATFLEFADDFAPEGLNRAFNAAGRAVFAAQNIKDAAKEMSILSGISVTTLATFGAIAAVGFLIVDATSKAREQAEKRLLNENLISGAINRQIIGLQKAKEEYEKFERSLEKDKSFSNRITSAVNTSDAGAIKSEREKIRAENRSRVEEINSLKSDLEQKERSLEFAKNRNVNQNLFTEIGIGREYTASQKQQDVARAERIVKESQEALAKSQAALEKGKANLQQTDKALIDITDRQNKAFSNRFEIFQKSQQDSQKYEMRQFEELQKKNKKTTDETKKTNNLKIEFNDFFASAKSQENPFIKIFSDIDTAGERAQKRFGELGKEAVKMASDFEKAKLTKLLSETLFLSNAKALGFSQEARRIDRLPNNQRFEFTRALETLEQKVETALKIFNLDRQINETDFYSRNYNPNNPKSFAEYNRRGFNDDISQAGLQIRYAVEDIKNLKQFDTNGTGIYGQGAIANRILSAIPSLDELIKRLSNPFTRGEASFLIGERSNALKVSRDFERQKLSDFFEQQKYGDLRRQDARETISLLNNSSGLDRNFRNEQLIKITDELGTNNLDGGLLKARRQALIEKGNNEAGKLKEAETERQEMKARNQKIDDFLDKASKAFGNNAIKVEVSEGSFVDIRFNSNDPNATANVRGRVPTPSSMNDVYPPQN